MLRSFFFVLDTQKRLLEDGAMGIGISPKNYVTKLLASSVILYRMKQVLPFHVLDSDPSFQWG